MTIHPRYISRKHRNWRYVFVHNSSAFKGRIAGVRFADGQSEPMSRMFATRIAAAMGGKLRYGYCLDHPHVFGDCSPQERACALEAGGLVLGPEERFQVILARAAAVGHGVVGAEPKDALAELLALDDKERDEVLDSIEQELDNAEAAAIEEGELDEPEESEEGSDRDDGLGADGPEAVPDVQPGDGTLDSTTTRVTDLGDIRVDEAPTEGEPSCPKCGDAGHISEDGSLCTPDPDPPKFSNEKPPLLDEPHCITRKFLSDKTKGQIETWAQEHLGLSLDTRQNKDELISKVLSHPKVVEEITPES